MKRLLDRYFFAQIDRALDDGRPLTGWTRFAVERSESLQNYYRSMLDMELELRYPEVDCLAELPSVDATSRKNRHPATLFARLRSGWGVGPLLVSAMAVLGCFFAIPFLNHDKPISPIAAKTLGPEEKIDLDELLHSLNPPLDTLSRSVPTLAPLSPVAGTSPLDSSVGMILGFAEEPLDTTLTLFATARNTFSAGKSFGGQY